MSRLSELSQNLLSLKDERRKLEEQDQLLKDEISQIEQELIPLLQDLDAQNVKLEGLGTIFLQTTAYVRPIKEREEDFIKWLDDKGLGDLAKRTIHHKTLTSAYNEWSETDQPLPPPDLVVAFNKVEVRIRRS